MNSRSSRQSGPPGPPGSSKQSDLPERPGTFRQFGLSEPAGTSRQSELSEPRNRFSFKTFKTFHSSKSFKKFYGISRAVAVVVLGAWFLTKEAGLIPDSLVRNPAPNTTTATAQLMPILSSAARALGMLMLFIFYS